MSGLIRDILFPEDAVCAVCGAITNEHLLCSGCRAALDREALAYAGRWTRPDLPDARSAFAHRDIARDLVLMLKHQSVAAAADLLAGYMMPPARSLLLPPYTVVTYVTMPESRLRERGIDHGQLLARAVARRLSLPYAALLKRADAGHSTQQGLNRASRKRNLQGLFAAVCPCDGTILLVDDVITTGATTAECTKVLLEAGASSVKVLTATSAQ
ncbi:MAG: hypothetical protein MJ142_00570 [Clostridia bacterium]|nr:hypothetical protein [Clostridia bacterium]